VGHFGPKFRGVPRLTNGDIISEKFQPL